MKNKIFGALIVVAITIGAMINVNLNKVSNKCDLALSNVEALAQSEVTITCNAHPVPPGACWNFNWGRFGMSYTCYFTGYMYNHCYY